MFVLETIDHASGPTLAVKTERGHIPLAAAGVALELHLPDVSLFEHLAVWEDAWPKIAKIAAASAKLPGIETKGARCLQQFGAARKVICAGANYYKHLVEMDVRFEKEPSKSQFFFLKPPSALAGPGRSVPLDPSIAMLDWEVELVAVIGKRGHNIGQANALDHVAGYTVAVDVTARDRLFNPESIFKFDFLAGKGQDGFCPTAWGFVPSAFLPDPQSAHLRLAVNGVSKQDDRATDMIYGVAELVSWASRLMTLEPGDLLLTGSPAGVGFPRREFLKAGDVMRVELVPHLAFDAEVYDATTRTS